MSDSEQSHSSIGGSSQDEAGHPIDHVLSQRMATSSAGTTTQQKTADSKHDTVSMRDPNSNLLTGRKRPLEVSSEQPLKSQSSKAKKAAVLTPGERAAGNKVSRRQSPESGEVSAEGDFDLEDDIEAAIPSHDDISSSSCGGSSESDGSDDDVVDAKQGAATPAPLATPLGVVVLKEGQENERNSEMRRLLRMPRYFDPDYEEAGPRCFKCGGKGHMARDCTNQAKERPCFLCAQLGHDSRDCPNSLCFRCNRPGHMARDCPYGYKSNSWDESGAPMCLRCGLEDCPCAGQRDYVRAEGGCQQAYSDTDMRHVHCFNCGLRGHLSCSDMPSQPPKLSCYNCGEGGHTADECWKESTALVSRERLGGKQNNNRPLWANYGGHQHGGSASTRNHQAGYYRSSNSARDYDQQQYSSYGDSSRMEGRTYGNGRQPDSYYKQYNHLAGTDRQYQGTLGSMGQHGRYIEDCSYDYAEYTDYRQKMGGRSRR